MPRRAYTFPSFSDTSGGVSTGSVQPIWPTAGAPTTGTPPTNNLIALCNYYVSRLIFQYQTKPKAQDLIALMAKQGVADDMTTQVSNAFNLNTAVGVQQDTLAKYIGANRNSNTPVTVNFFGFALYAGGGSANGYNSYSSSSSNGFIFDRYLNSNLPNTAFTDTQFAFILMLQIALNYFDGTLAYIQSFLATFFSGQITVTDNLNMSLTYTVNAILPLSNTTLAQFLPRPMGCGISVVNGSNATVRVTTTGSTRVTTAGITRTTT